MPRQKFLRATQAALELTKAVHSLLLEKRAWLYVAFSMCVVFIWGLGTLEIT